MTVSYFETSALVKLVVLENGSDRSGTLWDASDTIATSRIAYVEARAALAWARRGGRLAAGDLERAKAALDDRFRSLDHVEVSASIVDSAADLAELHGLRGYDAVHLASALALEDSELIVVTWDRDLARAAGTEGLAVAGVSP